MESGALVGVSSKCSKKKRLAESNRVEKSPLAFSEEDNLTKPKCLSFLLSYLRLNNLCTDRTILLLLLIRHP